jgi:hypothetical protein
MTEINTFLHHHKHTFININRVHFTIWNKRKKYEKNIETWNFPSNMWPFSKKIIIDCCINIDIKFRSSSPYYMTFKSIYPQLMWCTTDTFCLKL